jgi:predicted O-methyltransferase YrrM
MKIELQYFKDIYDEKLAEGAIINDRMEGFREDYLVLHCLLRKYKPRLFMEIGTHTGFGTMIIKNALGKDSVVYSLDLPDREATKSKQHPISEGKTIPVGGECTLPFIQLRGDSLDTALSLFHCDGFYIDGEHDSNHVCAETMKALIGDAKIIVWHDADMPEVEKGIKKAMENIKPYNLYRVIDTRIMYATKKYP